MQAHISNATQKCGAVTDFYFHRFYFFFFFFFFACLFEYINLKCNCWRYKIYIFGNSHLPVHTRLRFYLYYGTVRMKSAFLFVAVVVCGQVSFRKVCNVRFIHSHSPRYIFNFHKKISIEWATFVRFFFSSNRKKEIFRD